MVISTNLMMTKCMHRARTRVDLEVCGGVMGHDCGYWNVDINLKWVHIGSKIVTSCDMESHVNNKYRGTKLAVVLLMRYT